MVFARFIAAAFLFCGASSAYAQDYEFHPMFENLAGNMAMIEMHSSVLRNALGIDGKASPAQRQHAQPRPGQPGVVRPEAPTPDYNSLSFVASATRRRANYAAFVEKSRLSDAAGAASLEQNLRDDPVGRMAPELAKFGL